MDRDVALSINAALDTIKTNVETLAANTPDPVPDPEPEANDSKSLSLPGDNETIKSIEEINDEPKEIKGGK